MIDTQDQTTTQEPQVITPHKLNPFKSKILKNAQEAHRKNKNRKRKIYVGDKRLKAARDKKGIDTNSPSYLKYKAIALEFIQAGYNNIRAIYKKYYPNTSEDSLQSAPYQLLDNLRFIAAMEEAYTELKIEDLDLAREVLVSLRKEMLSAKNSSDRTLAASWLGKTQAIFIDKSESKTEIVVKPEEKEELSRIRGSLIAASN